MRTSPRALLLTSLVLLSCAWFAGRRPASGADDDEAAIRERNAAFVVGWNKHDAKAMAAIWADDGDLVNPWGRVATGRGEVEKLLAEEHGAQGAMRSSRAQLLSDSVRFVTPEIAVADWKFQIWGMITPSGERPDPQSVHVTAVYRKAAGVWAACALRPYHELPALVASR